MKIKGSQSIAAPRDQVWAVFMESGRLSSAMDHYWLMEPPGENAYRGVLNVELGPLRGSYEGTLTLSQIEPPNGFQIGFDGQNRRGAFRGNGRIRLESHAQTTLIHYDGDIHFDGELANLSPRMLQANVNAVIRRSIEGVRRALWPEKHIAGVPLTRTVYPWESWPRAAIILGLLAVGGLIIALVFGKRRRHTS
ncbi:MAG: hypothetical protein GY803_26185 [Chloroflexi bacterium]|nr:hypothetical protein [Chloroflexota bacterium]